MKKDIKEKIENDPDFIYSKKYNFSLKEMMSNKTVIKDHLIAVYLKMNINDVRTEYDKVIKIIRQKLKIDL